MILRSELLAGLTRDSTDDELANRERMIRAVIDNAQAELAELRATQAERKSRNSQS